MDKSNDGTRVEFDLHRLRLLRELSRRGTITAVAVALSYSPATVSQQLAQLQREVGTTLLEPNGRGVRLTPEAYVLIDHADAVFARLELAEADLARARSEIVGTVRAAAFQTAILSLFPEALELLAERHPRLRVEISQAESELTRSGLLPREFDIVIDEVYPGSLLARSDLLDQRTLLEDRMRLAQSTRSAPTGGLRSYADAAWAMEPAGSPAREWAVAACRAAGFEPDIQYESTDVIVHERLAATGRAVAFLPDLLPPTPGLPLGRHQLDPEHVRRVVATTRAAARRHPAVGAVLDALGEVAASRKRDAAETPS